MQEPRTDEQLAAFVRGVVQATVKETLLTMGIDATDPIKFQRFMANLSEIERAFENEQFRKDQLHLRRWRESMERASNIGIGTALTMVATGLLTALWLGLRHYFQMRP